MYNGHEYLSCIKIPIGKQAMTKTQHSEKSAMDLAVEQRDLILAANNVFGKGKWNHTVVNQNLDFVETVGAKCCVGCVTFIKVQLENENFHEDIGYYTAEESTKGSSIHNARIGSAINALKRVLLSFGDEIEKELQQIQKQINSKQANEVERDAILDKQEQFSEKSNTSVKTYSNTSSHTSVKPNQISIHNKLVSASHLLQMDSTNLKKDDSAANNNKTGINPEIKSNSTNKQKSKSDSIEALAVNSCITEVNPSIKDEDVKTIKPSLTEKNSTNEQKSKSELSTSEMQRLERKRRQQEKQMEFKRRMMEKEGLISVNDNKPNPRY